MQLITGKGHLFKAMAGRLVQQANCLLPREGLPVNFSMLIWSLGTLNYHPGTLLLLSAPCMSLAVHTRAELAEVGFSSREVPGSLVIRNVNPGTP